MRGEDVTCDGAILTEVGSPPHARGRRRSTRSGNRPRRITPACAGKTTLVLSFHPEGADHPRMRGEDCDQARADVEEPGSPPHARGRLARESRHSIPFGITPACAGKTLAQKRTRLGVPDHPRMRGEDGPLACGTRSAQGSPPHARGRRADCKLSGCDVGITPACAGKTTP